MYLKVINFTINIREVKTARKALSLTLKSFHHSFILFSPPVIPKDLFFVQRKVFGMEEPQIALPLALFLGHFLSLWSITLSVLFPDKKLLSSIFQEYVALHAEWTTRHDCTACILPQNAGLNFKFRRCEVLRGTLCPCTALQFRRRVNRLLLPPSLLTSLDRRFPKHPSVSDFNFNVGRGPGGEWSSYARAAAVQSCRTADVRDDGSGYD